jgi:4-amino-4-deoxy-L-arabinose transferase-like glycosyltransferase
MLGLLCASTIFLMLFHLGKRPLWDYDESTYAIITHEELQSGHWFSQTFMGRPFYEKPPLFMWLTGASAGVLGESEFSLRLPSALAGIALVFVTVLLAFELSGTMYAGLLAGAILLTTAPLIEVARQVRMDVPVTLFIVLAAYALVRGRTQRQWFLLFGISVALAALTKSIIALFALAAAPVFGAWLQEWRWLRDKYFWMGIGAGVLVALPWHLYELWRFGVPFLRTYLGFSIAQRVSTNLFNTQPHASNGSYLWYLANFAQPWAQLFTIGTLAVAAAWRHISTRIRGAIFANVTMVLLVVLVFFSAATKAPTYLVPLFPFMAVALSLGIAEGLRILRGAERVVCALLVGVCLALGLATTIYNGFHFNSYYAPTDQLSVEEKAAGQAIGAHTQSTWYVFGNEEELGSIMYYSRRIDPLALSGNTLKVGDIILMNRTEHLSFYAQHPNLSTVALYEGPQLLLLEVASED